MKKIILLLTILTGSVMQAQDRDKKFSAYTLTDPFAYSDGFNIGVGVEYQMNYIYLGAQVFTFPDLNGVSYNHLIGSLGFNLHTNNSLFRGYAGLNGGTIIRNGTHALFGFEAGIDFKIPHSNIFLGIGATTHLRGDSKIWGNESAYWRNNGFIKIGFLF